MYLILKILYEIWWVTSRYEKVGLGENYFKKLDRKIQMEDWYRQREFAFRKYFYIYPLQIWKIQRFLTVSHCHTVTLTNTNTRHFQWPDLIRNREIIRNMTELDK